MSARSSLAATVERALLVLHELQEQLLAVQTATGSEGDFEVVSTPEPGHLAPALGPVPSGSGPILRAGSVAWQRALQEAATPGDFLALDLSPVSPLLAGQRLSTIQGWTDLARLGAALRSGIIARDRLRGETPHCGTPIQLPWGVKIHVVLRARDHPNGFWTTNSVTYFREVGDPFGKGNLPPGTIQYSCATRVEALAFLLGAGVQWPVQLQ